MRSFFGVLWGRDESRLFNLRHSIFCLMMTILLSSQNPLPLEGEYIIGN
jgi:hypothetical protein